MNFRQHLTHTISILDKYPQIKTDKLAEPVNKALTKFHEKFSELIDQLDEQRFWEELKSRLVKMTHSAAEAEIGELNAKDFTGLCKLLKITPKATKKLSAKESAEIKVSKKIDDIRRQTY